jgi:hypothetical protein
VGEWQFDEKQGLWERLRPLGGEQCE